jgi:predicted GIY-YIG superfamily endonuclease
MNPRAPHALYRFFADDGSLLYVGITWNIAARFPQHATEKPWWSEVANITIEAHPNRVAVLEAERQAISAESPRYNIVHAVAPPVRVHTGRWGRLVREVPELDLALQWVEQQAIELVWLEPNRQCGLELWYGYPPAMALTGCMGIRDLVTALAGWGAGERVWPEQADQDDTAAIGGLSTVDDFCNEPTKPLAPRSDDWEPPWDLQRRDDDAVFVRKVVFQGWDAPEVLRTTTAYDAVYERFLQAMPDCRGCACLEVVS